MKKYEWPRYDPSRGYMLCEPCWNYRHYSYYRDSETGKMKRKRMCAMDICDCPCTGRDRPKEVKFTGEGQATISMENPLEIGPKS